MLGLTLEDLGDTAAYVWPENLPAVNAFIALLTQWRVGMAGATGLDYGVLPSVFRLTGIPRSEWPDTFDCIRTMEGEALKIMSEKRKDG